jgi:A/G-specific adenine glycosylase
MEHVDLTLSARPSGAGKTRGVISAVQACDDARAMPTCEEVQRPREHPLVAPLLDWYAVAARDLPWRRPDAGPWAVLVSEVMLQQTPVSRVLPAYEAWLARWPAPHRLAADSPGEAVRMWGKLGYPRRALRLHACATALVRDHDGQVPDGVDELLALPGVGAYTARAVAAFAFGRRVPVVDTNVQRVITRAVGGVAAAASPVAERDRAAVAALLPGAPARSARFGVAVMELGALVCTARTPRCGGCPIAAQCAWRLAGSPAAAGATRRAQRFTGTDRQVRGRLLDVLRGSDRAVSAAELDLAWPEPVQRSRALDALIADGLVDPLPDGSYALPA